MRNTLSHQERTQAYNLLHSFDVKCNSNPQDGLFILFLEQIIERHFTLNDTRIL